MFNPSLHIYGSTDYEGESVGMADYGNEAIGEINTEWCDVRYP